jgi:DNA-binding transcriptional MerR regulator
MPMDVVRRDDEVLLRFDVPGIDPDSRRYSRVEITRVQYVVELVDEGMTLAAIRRILELEHQVLDLDRRVRELTRPARGRPAHHRGA